MKISVELNLDLWIARDSEENVVIFDNKPSKHPLYNFWVRDSDGGEIEDIYISKLICLFPNLEDYFDFSKVQWKDDEPKQLKDILIKNHE